MFFFSQRCLLVDYRLRNGCSHYEQNKFRYEGLEKEEKRARVFVQIEYSCEKRKRGGGY
jgi:hypothetical protein